MDPSDFVGLAKSLLFGNPQPCNVRTATSRAYYGAHHAAANLLRAIHINVRESGKGHPDVYLRLQNTGNDEINSLGQQLHGLHSRRIKADYKLKDLRAENRQNAQADVEVAEQIIRKLLPHLTGPNRHQVAMAIRQWEALTGYS